MRIDFNTSINSTNTPAKNDQKVTVEDAKGAWDHNTMVFFAVQRTLKMFTLFTNFSSL
jgi:hypothetical protein